MNFLDKTAIKKFATSARIKLIEGVKLRALKFGISEDEIVPVDELTDGLIINGQLYNQETKKKYQHLIRRIELEGYETVMEEAAYTWFNRLIALRYMEMNDFLPIRTRILSSESDKKNEPDAVTEAVHLVAELELDLELVYHLKDMQNSEELFKYLLVMQSQKLGKVIPAIFSPITEELALLLPDNLLQEDSVIRELVYGIKESDWLEIEIIGWLYQFYISEQKDLVFANLAKNKKLGKEDIPAATQLFTPRWIVEYMVDNSLGRLWLENHPNEVILAKMNYYLPEAEQTESVQIQLQQLKDPTLNPEQIKFLDPCCGSGHILVYTFELLMEIYLSHGYLKQDIPILILKHNLYGVDIDKRAAQLASFALVMKARSYDRRLFNRDFQLNISGIQESNGLNIAEHNIVAEVSEFRKELEQLIATFKDAKLYGSILKLPQIDIALIQQGLDELMSSDNQNLFIADFIEYDLPLIYELIQQYQILTEKYEVVVTNPPYMGAKGMNPELSKYVKKYYPNTKSDLFAVFMDVTKELTRKNYYTATINQHAWMFLSSYEKLRAELLETETIINMAHLGTRAFAEIGGEVVQNTTFVLRNMLIEGYNATYIRLVDVKNAEEKAREFYNVELKNSQNQDGFVKIPGSPIAYWVSSQFIKIFENMKYCLADKFEIKSGIMTGNDPVFLRLWFEVSSGNLALDASNKQFKELSRVKKWFPVNKGGSYRLYFGNNEYVIDLQNSGRNIKESKGNFRLRDSKYYFNQGITWSRISSSYFAFRIQTEGTLFGDASPLIINGDLELLAFLNSKITPYLLNAINPTINIFVSDIEKLPYPNINKLRGRVTELSQECISISKADWDSFETSWDFEKHPFLTYQNNHSQLSKIYQDWETVTMERFNQLKANEEELNRIFIDLYELQDELAPEVPDKEVTVRKADKARDVRSFLSYLVGVIFGRYSLDQPGLAFAGGTFDSNHYHSFNPDSDNIIPITHEHYFEDDIIVQIEELISLIYGADQLEPNLAFIAEALEMKANEDPRERIRRYFMKEFYKDHLKIYQKRPIYWQFTSGKLGAFKGLMYLHRYDSYTLARLRTDYVLALTKTVEDLIGHADIVIDGDATPKVIATARKEKEGYQKQLEELRNYDLILKYLADQEIELELDDGVKVNYTKFQGIEIGTDVGKKITKMNIFEKI